jgi:transketolase
MTIINPCDDVEAKAAVKAALDFNGPVYMRFGRLAVPVVNDAATYKFELGKGVVMKDGKDVTIVATGLMVNEALEAARALENDGISARVVNIHTIKPLDKELIAKCAQETGVIVTAEEHSIIGGLGSAVAEVLSEKMPTKMMRTGIMDCYGESGTAAQLIEKYGLDGKGIAAKTAPFVKG